MDGAERLGLVVMMALFLRARGRRNKSGEKKRGERRFESHVRPHWPNGRPVYVNGDAVASSMRQAQFQCLKSGSQ